MESNTSILCMIILFLRGMGGFANNNMDPASSHNVEKVTKIKGTFLKIGKNQNAFH